MKPRCESRTEEPCDFYICISCLDFFCFTLRIELRGSLHTVAEIKCFAAFWCELRFIFDQSGNV